MIKEIISIVFVLGLITWALIDFASLQTVVGALSAKFVQLVQAIADAAESAV